MGTDTSPCQHDETVAADHASISICCTTKMTEIWQLESEAKFITVTSQWARWRLKSPASPLCTQLVIEAQIKENIKAPRHWPLCGEFTGDR